MEAAKPSWAFGAGATRAEKGLAYAVSLFGICALVVGGHGLGWTWWQWLIGALLVHDLAGGVVANGLDTAKLFYHSPLTFTDSVFARFVHHPVGFTAIHLQPVLIALVIPGGGAAETAGRPRLCRHRDHGGGLCRLPSGARVAAGGPAAEARPRPWGAGASRPARRRGRSGRRIAGRCSVKSDERMPFGCQMTGALRTTCVHSLFCRGGIPAWGTKVNASSSVFFAICFLRFGNSAAGRRALTSTRPSGRSSLSVCTAKSYRSRSSCSHAIRCESGSANSSFTFTL